MRLSQEAAELRGGHHGADVVLQVVEIHWGVVRVKSWVVVIENRLRHSERKARGKKKEKGREMVVGREGVKKQTEAKKNEHVLAHVCLLAYFAGARAD